MGTLWLDYLADVLRGGGLNVIEVGKGPGLTGPEWKQRARSSTGAYDPPGPVGFCVHHTADGGPRSDGWPGVNHGTFFSPSKPIMNIYTARSGTIYVCAAGATNTEGNGGPLGPIPLDGANRRVVSNEIANTGIGERYPQVQQDAVLEAQAIMLIWVAKQAGWWHSAPPLAQHELFAHFEWAPTRKIDPSGPSRWSNDENRKWDMARFRADVLARANAIIAPPPPPPPPPPSSDVTRVESGWYWVRRGDSPWSAAQRCYGNGQWFVVFQPTDPASPGFTASDHAIHTPGIGGVITNVQAGEGPYALIRRMRPDRNPADWLTRFYDFNGGETRTLKPGEVVFLPDW